MKKKTEKVRTPDFYTWSWIFVHLANALIYLKVLTKSYKHLPTPSWCSLKLRLRWYLIVFDPPTYVLDQGANSR